MKKILKNVLFQILSLVIAIGTIGVTYATWTTLNATQGATGQPVDQTLMQGIISNLNDLATRVGALEPINEMANCIPASTTLMNANGTPKTFCYKGTGEFSCNYAAWRQKTNISGYISDFATYLETVQLPSTARPYFSKTTIYCTDQMHLATNPKNYVCYQNVDYGAGGPARDLQVLNLTNYCMIY